MMLCSFEVKNKKHRPFGVRAVYGVRDTALEWFKSHLSNRKQYVYSNGESSQLKDITCGIPQGSVLRPLLFLIYINDLPNISKLLQFFLFADDTNIYHRNNWNR